MSMQRQAAPTTLIVCENLGLPARPSFPCLPRVSRRTENPHHDRSRHHCFIPQMESTLTKAESYCSISVDGHFPRTMQEISVRTAHSQIAPITNKPQSSNTAHIQQSTNVHCAHHDIQILPQGQRGIRIEQDTSTCFGSKRQTATQKNTHTSQSIFDNQSNMRTNDKSSVPKETMSASLAIPFKTIACNVGCHAQSAFRGGSENDIQIGANKQRGA